MEVERKTISYNMFKQSRLLSVRSDAYTGWSVSAPTTTFCLIFINHQQENRQRVSGRGVCFYKKISTKKSRRESYCFCAKKLCSTITSACFYCKKRLFEMVAFEKNLFIISCFCIIPSALFIIHSVFFLMY